MKYVRITKIAHRSDAKYPEAKAGSWEHGTEHPDNVSLPVDYTVEGWVDEPPKIGQSLQMERHARNGVRVLGYFTTSPVVDVWGRLDGWDGHFKTENSVYRIEAVEPPASPSLPVLY